MHKRPEHLTAENAQAFQAPSVAERYQLRSPYPGEMFSALLPLVVDAPRTVLDAGAGTGDIARRTITKSLDDYISSFHSASSLSLDRMSAADAAEFDLRLRRILLPYTSNGSVALQISGSVVWGRPVSGEDQ
jgi:hypothetical protein